MVRYINTDIIFKTCLLHFGKSSLHLFSLNFCSFDYYSTTIYKNICKTLCHGVDHKTIVNDIAAYIVFCITQQISGIIFVEIHFQLFEKKKKKKKKKIYIYV